MRTRSLTAALALAGCVCLTAAAAPVDGGDPVQRDLRTARFATGAYFSEELAEAADFQRTEQCVDSPEGGMGYHYVNQDNIGSTHPGRPAAVLYAPGEDGDRTMVALEYIVPAEEDPDATEPPVMFGQPFRGPITDNQQLGPHYALHVWLWKHNPDGLFADWNPKVRCPAGEAAPSERPSR